MQCLGHTYTKKNTLLFIQNSNLTRDSETHSKRLELYFMIFWLVYLACKKNLPPSFME